VDAIDFEMQTSEAVPRNALLIGDHTPKGMPLWFDHFVSKAVEVSTTYGIETPWMPDPRGGDYEHRQEWNHDLDSRVFTNETI
jgi:hypothetical protein